MKAISLWESWASLIRCNAKKIETRGRRIHYERLFGNYVPGRYAWILENIRPVEPFAIKGQQGFFNVPDEMIHSQETHCYSQLRDTPEPGEGLKYRDFQTYDIDIIGAGK